MLFCTPSYFDTLKFMHQQLFSLTDAIDDVDSDATREIDVFGNYGESVFFTQLSLIAIMRCINN